MMIRFGQPPHRLGRERGLAFALTDYTARWSPYPAPPGYRWEFVLSDLDGSKVEDDLSNEPIVELVRAA